MLEFTKEELDFIAMLANEDCLRSADNADYDTDIDYLIQRLSMSRNLVKKISLVLDKPDEGSNHVDEL